ncbi:MAG: CoA transferase, partial [Alphaproteobacteria bacterium]|nr:CoA transferase [Alphaproteobacteria bacterium]
MTQPNPGPLSGVRVLDLTRILAGPTCTQLLGDMGADILKIERPGEGDDTRKWGPPYLKDQDGADTKESGYYLSSNRNKRSVAVDVADPEGQELVRRLLKDCDILVQNFKAGGLAKYGLDYESLRAEFPRLVYCSISGFGQTGPYASQAGYDYLAQGQGGIMSITGEPDGAPIKVGIGISDVVCGLYAASAVLAALRHRDVTGRGQHVDLALLDSTVAWLVNVGVYHLLTGEMPRRLGNAHPNIVPYQLLPSEDGYFILAVGNDSQFRKFCEFAGRPEWADDERFRANSNRVKYRETLMPMIEAVTRARAAKAWVEGLAALGVPAGPVNDVGQVFQDPQVLHRGMKIAVPNPDAQGGAVPLIGNPLKFSDSPVAYRRAPPRLGQHTGEVLKERLGLSDADLARL